MHVLTGPIYVEGAEPGDVVTVEILELEPRKNPDGESFGSNAAAWWGYDFGINGPSPPPLANASMDGQIEVRAACRWRTRIVGGTVGSFLTVEQPMALGCPRAVLSAYPSVSLTRARTLCR